MDTPTGKRPGRKKGALATYGGKKKGERHIQDSPNARAVARDVIDTVNQGKKVVMKDIIMRHGYTETVGLHPAGVTKTAAYKDEYNTYLARLEKHRESVISAMEKKDLNEEQYRTLSDTQTKLTHDVQLLSGGKTENVGLEQDRQTLKAIVAAIQIDE